jgi:hypothetical protein
MRHREDAEDNHQKFRWVVIVACAIELKAEFLWQYKDTLERHLHIVVVPAAQC